MEGEGGHRRLSSLIHLLLWGVALSFHHLQWTAEAIPAKFDGFVYGKSSAYFNPKAVMIEAFFDPVCPDSRDAWPPLKQAIDYYGSQRVSLSVHPFPLPYHDNAFVTSRALHIVNKVNCSATFTLLEKFYQEQPKFYNKATINVPRNAVVDELVNFVCQSLGSDYFSAVKSGFSSTESDLKTRISFKYGCSRGVFGTPFFFVNGFALEDAGSAIDYSGWRRILDPLVAAADDINQGSRYFI